MNALTHTPPFAGIAKRLAGIAPQRTIPRFAHHTFQHWFRKRGGAKHPQGAPVLLWPDTFNNHFHPEIAKAAVEVLESAGFQVRVPRAKVCCGRPLYDIGMLPRARRLLRRNLRLLRADITAGVPVIGLEPACTATFVDELVNLFPHDQQAQRLAAQTFTFAGFVQQHHDAFDFGRLDANALLHLHCNHKAILSKDPDQALLERIGVKTAMPDTGCCGMAGAFGFEADKYEVAMACGERVLLPAVREAHDQLVVTDGYSCREQIQQATGRRALHMAEVAQMALRQRAL